jgi:hypothetical protein
MPAKIAPARDLDATGPRDWTEYGAMRAVRLAAIMQTRTGEARLARALAAVTEAADAAKAAEPDALAAAAHHDAARILRAEEARAA